MIPDLINKLYENGLISKKDFESLSPLKKDYDKSIKQSQKRTVDIQTPEVQARMKQNKKDYTRRDRHKKKKIKAASKEAGGKYN